MGSYKIVWKRSAERELRRLPPAAIARVLDAVEGLRENPKPRLARKLIGVERTYRLRVGDFRVVYAMETERLVVEVVRVRHRRDAYR